MSGNSNPKLVICDLSILGNLSYLSPASSGSTWLRPPKSAPILIAFIQALTASQIDYCYAFIVFHVVIKYTRREKQWKTEEMGRKNKRRWQYLQWQYLQSNVGTLSWAPSSIPRTWTHPWEVDHYWKKRMKSLPRLPLYFCPPLCFPLDFFSLIHSCQPACCLLQETLQFRLCNFSNRLRDRVRSFRLIPLPPARGTVKSKHSQSDSLRQQHQR